MIVPAPHPSAVAEQLISRDYLSFSAVSLYQRCPLAFQFKYVFGIPEETVSSSLAFGGGVHAALELWFRELMCGNEAPDQDSLLGEFWDSWRSRNETASIAFGKGDALNSVGHLADRVLTAFRTSELAWPAGSILGVEEELREAVVPEAPDILARIDLLVESAEALTVIDFKTARSRWGTGQAQDQAEQLLLYGELARQIAPGKELRLEFQVLSKTKNPTVERHPVHLDEQRIRRTKKVVQHVWRAIESGHFFPAPSPINCPSCPFREPCRHWPG